MSAGHIDLSAIRAILAGPGGHHGVMQAAVDDLIELLDLEAIEVNIFRGVSPEGRVQRIFGGQVAGQALVAAARTVEQGSVHSLHAYFLRPGDPTIPVLYEVDRIRDGRSFTTRRVVAIQHGRAIFNMSASFHGHEDGLNHQDVMPTVPTPDQLPTRAERMAGHSEDLDKWLAADQPFDIRYITASPVERTEPLPPTQQVWLRADGDLPDDPVLHTCLLTYVSDMTLLDTTLLAHGHGSLDERVMMASLDHAMWFHGPFKANNWLLYDQHSPSASGGRGLSTGRVFTAEGRLVASVVQEGLIRPVRPATA